MAINKADKDILYVDIDDDITSVIDKVKSSESRLIALVLPKRATVFQSIVNMKLLKRSAELAKKQTVLVTTEPSIMPLAGTVGLYVASSPQSQPRIPAIAGSSSPIAEDLADEVLSLNVDDASGLNNKNAANQTVGELAGDSSSMPTPPEGIETLTLPEEESASETVDDTKVAKPGKDKKLKVPSFNRFRKWLLLAFIIVLLLVGLILALKLLPKATITISSKTSNVNVSLTATLDPSASTPNINNLTIPAKTEQQQETTSQQVSTTGQQNNGTAATGQVTLTNCSSSGNSITIPSGTGVSTNNLTYITQSPATLATSTFDKNGNCKPINGVSSATVNITAVSPGSNYNTQTSVAFTVAGYPNGEVEVTGSASGGTDNIVQVVSQTDINNATQKLAAQNTNAIKSTLEQQLRAAGYYPLPATFNAGAPNITPSSPVGSPASTVTVTQTVTYLMYGAKNSDLDALVASNVNSQIDTSNQTILNYGLANASFGVVGTSAGSEQLSIQTNATVGPDINIKTIKKEIVGLKSGSVQQIIGQISGVTKVNVQFSPFWVNTVPNNPSKVTIIINKAL